MNAEVNLPSLAASTDVNLFLDFIESIIILGVLLDWSPFAS
jgi:hypothetical protein